MAQSNLQPLLFIQAEYLTVSHVTENYTVILNIKSPASELGVSHEMTVGTVNDK